MQDLVLLMPFYLYLESRLRIKLTHTQEGVDLRLLHKKEVGSLIKVHLNTELFLDWPATQTIKFLSVLVNLSWVYL